MNFSLYIVL